jgi:CobQ-like glutamine amidotransferase family enzyme
VIGTYVHGPLLPKNAWLCDWLTARALGVEPGELAPLDDALEDAAHATALAVTGLGGRALRRR